MSVHYKFKSTLDFDTVKFDGLHISVADLKRAIIQQKRLGKITDFDLQITNAQNREVYWEDTNLIPKNTSLIVSRVPLVHHQKKSYDSQNETQHQQQTRSSSKIDSSLSVDIFKMKGSEEDKIQEMMMQSTVDYDPNSYVKIKGQSQTGDVPASYRCNKCKKGGHWIKNCTFVVGKSNSDVKRNTGIPKSFLDKEDKIIENDTNDDVITGTQSVQSIPEELLCSICNDLFVDAVMIPCCGSSFCDDCVRSALLDSDENECPDCKEKGCSPASLIPNRFLRNSVNIFKSETGYKKAIVKTSDPSKNNVNNKDNKQIEPVNAKKESDSPSHLNNLPQDSKSDGNTRKNINESEKTNLIKSELKNVPSGMATHQTNPNHLRTSNDGKPKMQHSDWNRENDNNKSIDIPKSINIQRNEMSSRKKSHDIFAEGCNNLNIYQPIPTHTQLRQEHPMCQAPQQIPFHSLYNEPRHVENIRYTNFNPMPYFPNTNTGYLMERCHQTSLLPQAKPVENLSSIFQSVEQKVGTGIIDDPLEVFNRIMKEKEKRRRRSPELSRQRKTVIDRNSSRYQRRSIVRETRNHNHRKEKTGRYRDSSRDRSYRRRSNSFSDRSPRNSQGQDSTFKQSLYNKRSCSPPPLRDTDEMYKKDDKRYYNLHQKKKDSNKADDNKRHDNFSPYEKEPTPPGFDSGNKVSSSSKDESIKSSPKTPPRRNSLQIYEHGGRETSVENRLKRYAAPQFSDLNSPNAKTRKYSISSDKKILHSNQQDDKEEHKQLETITRFDDEINKSNSKIKSSSPSSHRQNNMSQNVSNADLSEGPNSLNFKLDKSNDDSASRSDKKSKQGKKRRKEKDDRKKLKKHKRDKEKKVKDSLNEKRNNKEDSNSLKPIREDDDFGSQQEDCVNGKEIITDMKNRKVTNIQTIKAISVENTSNLENNILGESFLINDISPLINENSDIDFPNRVSEKGMNKSDNENLKKAENNIFTRAINAIRITEKPKSEYYECIDTNSNRNSFEITVPTKDFKERSVKLKNDHKNKTETERGKISMSIKDRLGTKRQSPHKESRGQGSMRSANREKQGSFRQSHEKLSESLKIGHIQIDKNDSKYKFGGVVERFNNTSNEKNERQDAIDKTQSTRIPSVCVDSKGKYDSHDKHKSYRYRRDRDSSESKKDNVKNKKTRKSPKKKKDKKQKKRK